MSTPPLPSSPASHRRRVPSLQRKRSNSLPKTKAPEKGSQIPTPSELDSLSAGARRAWDSLFGASSSQGGFYGRWRAETKNEMFHSDILTNKSYVSELELIIPMCLIRYRQGYCIGELVEALACHLPEEIGTVFICSIVRNLPEALEAIVCALTRLATRNGERASELLLTVAAISPYLAVSIRKMLVQGLLLPNLVLTLTCRLEQPLAFLHGLFSESDTALWFSRSLKAQQPSHPQIPIPFSAKVPSQNSHMAKALKSLLNTSLQRELNSRRPDKRTLQLIFRLYIVLSSIGVTFQSDEAHLLVSSLQKIKDQHTVQLGITLLLICEDVIRLCSVEKVTNALKSISQHNICSEFLLLVAIHLHTQNHATLLEFLQSSLTDGRRDIIHLHFHSVTLITQIITQHIFPEQQLVSSFHRTDYLLSSTSSSLSSPLSSLSSPLSSLSSSSSSSPSSSLSSFSSPSSYSHTSASSLSSLSLPCVCILMCSNTFSKFQVDIGPWLFQQLDHFPLPVSPLLASLIDFFIESTLVAYALPETAASLPPISSSLALLPAEKSEFRMRTIPEKHIRQHVTAGELTTRAVLLIYYVLRHNARVQTKKMEILARRLDSHEFNVFSDDLVDRFPVVPLMRHLEKHRYSFEFIYSTFTALIVERFSHFFSPHIFLGHLKVVEAEILPFACLGGRPTVNSCIERLRLLEERPVQGLLALSRLCHFPVGQLLGHHTQQGESNTAQQILKACVPPMLKKRGSVSHQAQEAFAALWERLFINDPWHIAFETMLLLSDAPLTASELTKDPLLILGCKTACFESPQLAAIVLQILRFFLDNSQRALLNELKLVSPSHPRSNVIHSLILAQASAAIQMLLELCHLYATPPLCSLCCRYIHQEFLDQPILIRLVHFQGYRLELLPIVVAGIDSMHVCLDFLPELLAEPQPEKQIFAMRLGALIIKKYPIQKSLQLARIILRHLASSNPLSAEGVSFFTSALPALPPIAQAFPILTDEIITSLLLQLQERIASGLSPSQAAPLLALIQAVFLQIVDPLL